MTVADIRAVLSAYLMAAGTTGRTESQMVNRFKHIPKEDLITELEVLWELKKVQRFTIDKKRVWRATVDLNV